MKTKRPLTEEEMRLWSDSFLKLGITEKDATVSIQILSAILTLAALKDLAKIEE